MGGSDSGQAKENLQPHHKVVPDLKAPEGLIQLLKDLPRSAPPTVVKPMKATLVDQPFDEAGWIYEIKWDGYRAVAVAGPGQAQLISRNNLVFDQFSPISGQLGQWNMNVVLDGEIVALNDKGTADFGDLQNWRNAKHAHLVYYVFDIIWYEGYDLTSLPPKTRKEILDAVIPNGSELVRVSQTFKVGGIEFFEAAKRMGLEGIIAKRADSVYTSDIRSREWLKIKAKKDRKWSLPVSREIRERKRTSVRSLSVSLMRTGCLGIWARSAPDSMSECKSK